MPRLIHVMDREGDVYEVMMAVIDAGDGAIIRCAQNRRVEDPLADGARGGAEPAGAGSGGRGGGPHRGRPRAPGVGGSCGRCR